MHEMHCRSCDRKVQGFSSPWQEIAQIKQIPIDVCFWCWERAEGNANLLNLQIARRIKEHALRIRQGKTTERCCEYTKRYKDRYLSPELSWQCRNWALKNSSFCQFHFDTDAQWGIQIYG